MKIIFMGTPDFAGNCLKKLIETDNEIVGVFSQPDKPVGRKQILTPPNVKVIATENNIPVYQPTSMKDGKALEIIKALSPDVLVVVAYGKILPKEILNIAKYGAINVHASLLPLYRGAAPIQWSIINGDKETGVTIMKMDEGLDTGDILKQVKTDIDINETSEMLFDRLSIIGADALINTLDNIDNISPVKQPIGDYMYASMIDKSMSPIDWNLNAYEIHNIIRGLQTWPCAETTLNGKKLKVHKSILSDYSVNNKQCGEVTFSDKKLIVACKDSKCIEILEVQLDGKKRTDVKSFLLGNKIGVGTILGK